MRLKQAKDFREVTFTFHYSQPYFPPAAVAAVKQRWHDLLDARHYGPANLGQVVLSFHLHTDGPVSDFAIVEKTVSSELAGLCQSAAEAAAPFARLPEETG
jgi:hypothetical protein